MRSLGIIAVVAGLLLPGGAAADYLKYTNESGTLCFTDDAKRVPARYRDQAERIPERGLASYERLTIVPRAASIAPAEDVWAEPAEPVPDEAEAAPSGMTFQVPAGAGTSLEISTSEGHPVHVRTGRGRWTDDGYYKPHVTVEQDGKTLAEIEMY